MPQGAHTPVLQPWPDRERDVHRLSRQPHVIDVTGSLISLFECVTADWVGTAVLARTALIAQLRATVIARLAALASAAET
jgi:hypothetical protein